MTATRPPVSAWTRFASEEAILEGLAPSLVLGGHKTPRAVYARWRAWQRLREAYPKSSGLAIAKLCGFDHSSLLHAEKRLATGDPKFAAPRPNKIAQFLRRPLQATRPTA